MLTTLPAPGTKSTVTACPPSGTDSVAVSPVSSASARSCARAGSRTSSRASTRSASTTRWSPSRYGPPGSRSTRPPASSVASSRDALLGFTPIRRASALTPAGPSARASSSATARATEPTGRPAASVEGRLVTRPSGSAGDQLELRAPGGVLSADGPQHVDHRHRRRRAVAGQRGRVDLTDGRVAAERPDDDVVAHGPQPELRDQRHADAGGDEALHRRVVVGLERDPRVEAEAHAGLADHPVALAVGRAADPRLVREVGEPHAALVRQRAT